MIDVRLNRSEPGCWHLRVVGHGDAGPKGADVVCAGVSALVQTAARIDEVLRVSVTGSLAAGQTEVQFVAQPEVRDQLDVVMSVLANGMAAMARDHGRHLKFNELNEAKLE